MGRARNPKRDEAYKIWVDSDCKCKLKDIAAALDIPENRVRKWKSEDNWEKKKKEQSKKERSDKTPRKRGGQKGNKNAVGNKGGAPLGSQNNLKHGGYSSIYWDTLSDEERKYLEEEKLDEEALLIQQIDLCTIREMRLLKALKKYEDVEFKQEKSSGLTVSSVSTQANKRIFPNTEEGHKEKEIYEKLRQQKIQEEKISYLGTENFTITNTEATYNVIARLQAELTRVQRQKTQCIRELAELHERKAGGDRDNNIANDWITALEEAWKNEQ